MLLAITPFTVIAPYDALAVLSNAVSMHLAVDPVSAIHVAFFVHINTGAVHLLFVPFALLDFTIRVRCDASSFSESILQLAFVELSHSTTR
mmetsp:Transcript_48298/g.154234  ORF Transcript_48298/g.154234 Transcript_48298/m.154234 type:complete len:91 (-) Transcript_48298:604-876(-)